MRLRPLGWELSAFLIWLALLGLAVVTQWMPLLVAVLVLGAVLTPLVVIGFLVRLGVGILGELGVGYPRPRRG